MPSRLLPPEDKAEWEKAHGRLERRRIAHVAVTPEQIGLCGCWQVVAVQREVLDLTTPEAEPTVEIGNYATSLRRDEYDDEGVLRIIRDHWSSSENGTHYRRDMTLGEDACRTTHRQGAEVLATLRNWANGLYEVDRERGRRKIVTLKSWCQRQTFSSAHIVLSR